MQWNNGYSASYIMHEVDPVTFRDLAPTQITGGSIKRELTGKRESADIACHGIDIGIEKWVRVYIDTTQSGAHERTALFTGLASSPASEFDGNSKTNTLACYSVLKPCADVALPVGWYAPRNASGAEMIRRLLSATPAPVIVSDGSPTLSDHIIAESNETNLSMIDKILTAIDWRIRIEGNGTINVLPKPIEPVASFDPLDNDMIETRVTVNADWYSCPNVYRATSGDVTGIARDEDPNSPLSIPSRGREVWLTESNAKLASTESVAQYAQRKLKAAQAVKQVASYTRRYLPDVLPGDMVRMRYPKQGVVGLYSVRSQTITLGYGASTDEEITEV